MLFRSPLVTKNVRTKLCVKKGLNILLYSYSRMNQNIELLFGLRALMNIICDEISTLVRTAPVESTTATAPTAVLKNQRIQKKKNNAAHDIQSSIEASDTIQHVTKEDKMEELVGNTEMDHDVLHAMPNDIQEEENVKAVPAPNNDALEEKKERRKKINKRYRDKLKARMIQHIISP